MSNGSIEEIARALSGKKKSGGGYMCLCPAHADKNPSLSIDVEGDHLLLYCHAGCSSDDVIAELKARGLWSENGKRKTSDSSSIVKWYEYKDEDGKILFRKARRANKTFYIEPKGVAPTLYNLPGIARAKRESRTVIITEGEKDADTLNARGYIATTVAFGASSWDDKFAEKLEGVHVLLCGDHDAQGYEYIRSVARGLRRSAASIRFVKLPHQIHGKKVKDVSDFFFCGGTESEFESLVENATTEQPTEPLPAVEDSETPKPRKKKTAKLGQVAQATKIIEKIGAENILFFQEFFWLWKRTGVWQRVEDRELKQIVVNELREVKRGDAESIVDHIKTLTYWPQHKFDRGSPWVINCLNTELHYSEAEEGFIPIAHMRESYRTVQIPIEWQPTAKAPRFELFLDEIFAGETDIVERKQMLLEMVGYTLLSTCRFEKFILLTGDGANGKSVVLSVLEALCGPGNYSAIRPEGLEEDFLRAHLLGKLANIITELKEGEMLPDASLKSLISGEIQTACFKHRGHFEFRPYATYWFSCNHLPNTRDFSDALQRRTLILDFKRKFEGSEADTGLIDKLLGELPGILRMVVTALGAVIARGGEFTMCDSCIKQKDKWRVNNDQVRQFLADNCEAGQELWISSNDLYASYKKWAVEAGVQKPISRNNFSQRIERLGFSLGKRSGERTFFGLSTKFSSSII